LTSIVTLLLLFRRASTVLPPFRSDSKQIFTKDNATISRFVPSRRSMTITAWRPRHYPIDACCGGGC